MIQVLPKYAHVSDAQEEIRQHHSGGMLKQAIKLHDVYLWGEEVFKYWHLKARITIKGVLSLVQI